MKTPSLEELQALATASMAAAQGTFTPEPLECLFCGEPEKAEILEVWAPRDFMMDTCCAQMNEAVAEFLQEDPKYETGRFKGTPLSKLPWFSKSAPGLVLEGITGTSKSFTLQRILQLLPQKISHTESHEYGWTKLEQLVYLVVPMPTSARLGAFLLETALRMDAVLGTNYAEVLKSRGLSDDKRAVLVLHWLSIHRCGILIIEECQEKNLPGHVFCNDFLSLFLRVMNFGIPVLVIGNPKALLTIRTYTQDGRRFSAGHWFTFEPVWDYRSQRWTRDLVPRIWGWSPMPGEDQHIANLELYLWQKTGGITDYLVLLRKESLKTALRAGDLLPSSRTNLNEQGSAIQENRGHEKEQIHRGTDHRVPQAG